MILTVKPTLRLKGSVRLPASKSYSIRAFLIAACGGNSVIVHPSNCDDAVVARLAAGQLGSNIKQLGNNIFKVQGRINKPKVAHIHVKESGTVLRFIIPLAALFKQHVTVSGEGTLRGRPNHFLTKTLRSMGLKVKGHGVAEGIPIRISGGRLHGGRIIIDGTLSSQFISALLITCPQLEEDSTIILIGKKIVSLDYLTMTRQILKKSGVNVKPKGLRSFIIKAPQKFKGLGRFVVPSDYGLAAFLMAAAALIKSEVILEGYLKDDFIQADKQILFLLKKMGVKFTKKNNFIKMRGPYSFKGGAFSLKDAPDLVPIMAVLALFAKGRTRLYDIGHARVKESDRIGDLRWELLKVGAKIKEGKAELIIEPQNNYRSNVLLDPHKDHRLAMAFSILGLKLGTHVKDIECVSKSYPQFVRDLRALGGRMSRR